METRLPDRNQAYGRPVLTWTGLVGWNAGNVAMDKKRIAGEYAARFVEDGMLVGLGTGSTAYWAIRKLGERRSGGIGHPGGSHLQPVGTTGPGMGDSPDRAS